MTKLKNTDEKCKEICHGIHINHGEHCNPEKQEDWEERFKLYVDGYSDDGRLSADEAIEFIKGMLEGVEEEVGRLFDRVEKQTRESEREGIAEQLPRLFLEWRNSIDEQYEEGRRTGKTQVLLSFPDWLADQLKQKGK